MVLVYSMQYRNANAYIGLPIYSRDYIARSDSTQLSWLS
jgi:hypothetical protein